MSFSKEDLKELLEAQQKSMMANFSEILKVLKENPATVATPTDASNGQLGAPTVTAKEILMNSLVQKLDNFEYDAESRNTFDVWFRRFGTVFTEDGASLSDEEKIKVLVRKMSNSVFDRLAQITSPDSPFKKTFEEVKKILMDTFGSKETVFSLRYACMHLKKDAREDVLSFLDKVNDLCDRVEFSELKVEHFKSLVFVSALNAPEDRDIQRRILTKLEQEPKLTLKSLRTEVETYLKLGINLRTVTDDLSTIQAVGATNRHVKLQSRFHNTSDRNATNSKNEFAKLKPCFSCGELHWRSKCPHRSSKCNKCRKIGHIARVCNANGSYNVRNAGNSSSQRFHKNPRRQSNKIDAKQIRDYAKENSNAEVQIVVMEENKDYVDLIIQDKLCRLQMDSGSQITIVSEKFWADVLETPKLQKSDKTATHAAGGEIEILGMLPYLYAISIQEKFVNELKAAYPEVFEEGLGHCNQGKAIIKLKEGAQPAFCRARPVPLSHKLAVEQELARLEQMGVISHVDYSQWAAPIVVAKKANGKIRICADYSTGLNRSVDMHHYPLPLPEHLFAALNRGKVFSKIDFSDAYFQIEVAEECKSLLTINTHKGLFQYNRMPFGVKSAPGIFQQVMEQMCDDASHIEDLKRVFEKIRQFGFRVRLDKCEFFKKDVKYLGHVINAEGKKMDDAKIEAILKMPVPKNAKDLRAFLGLLNYNGKFVKILHELRQPLDLLLKKDTRWNWTTEQQRAFEKVKTTLVSPQLLAHYDPKQELIVAADASKTGIGGVLLQRYPDGSEKAVIHISRSLTPIINGCLMYRERVIIPTSLRNRVLKQLHQGHPGIERSKALARRYVYWPKIDDSIEYYVKNCNGCQKLQKAPRKTSLQSWPRASEPMERIHTDYAGPFEGSSYLLIVDAYSKWPEIYEMKSTTSRATIRKLQYFCDHYGSPKILVSDNGTQFTSHEFADFCELNGITHIRSAPYHPQSNGQVERLVDIFKRAILKLKGEETTADALGSFLRTYRSSPNPSLPNNASPDEYFLGRKIRTTLSLLNPVQKKCRGKRNYKMEDQFNRHHGAKLRQFKVGDQVLAEMPNYKGAEKRWERGMILHRIGNVNYWVMIGKKSVKRHCNQLRSIERSSVDPHYTPVDPLYVLLEEFKLPRPKTAEPVEDALNQSELENPTVCRPEASEDGNLAEEIPVQRCATPLAVRRPRRETRPPKIISPSRMNVAGQYEELPNRTHNISANATIPKGEVLRRCARRNTIIAL
uniref:RNA-directed DNA polymerase n=1 Tax=Acrobeloides nanus TaxID=290746 RepID=A0A914CQ61_9BILA